jgi:hypothetical protein
MRIVRGEPTVGEHDIEAQIWRVVGKQLDMLGG